MTDRQPKSLSLNCTAIQQTKEENELIECTRYATIITDSVLLWKIQKFDRQIPETK